MIKGKSATIIMLIGTGIAALGAGTAYHALASTLPSDSEPGTVRPFVEAMQSPVVPVPKPAVGIVTPTKAKAGQGRSSVVGKQRLCVSVGRTWTLFCVTTKKERFNDKN